MDFVGGLVTRDGVVVGWWLLSSCAPMEDRVEMEKRGIRRSVGFVLLLLSSSSHHRVLPELRLEVTGFWVLLLVVLWWDFRRGFRGC